ncbi:helix-turn-helix domain-containing protein [Streptomyces sp. NPDC005303]|uniref:helix-turn-helix domain-containing protein n=1 Tax=Streptomyces sp. NPDC005303 TaxID=3155713 RepID=UPI00339E73E4
MTRNCRIDDCTEPPRLRRRICNRHEIRIRRHGDPNFTEWSAADDSDVQMLIAEQRPAQGLTRLERVMVGRGLSAHGLPAAEVARILGVTERTVYRWRSAA